MTQSGYGVHSRQIARWLLENSNVNVQFQVLPWGNTPWFINGDRCNGMISKVMQKTVDFNAKGDVSFQVQLPNEWDPNLAKFNVGVTAAIETDTCNPAWIESCKKMHAIVVPSQHVKNCLTNTGTVTVPIHVIPESYIDEIETACDSNESLGHFSTDFNFLVFGQLTGNNPFNDRKNTFFTIKWLCEAFQNDKDVGIVIKTNAGRNTLIDKELITNTIKQLLIECRRGPYPKVHLLHGDMSDEDVANLYKHKQIKALVAPTRGEGFGLPILEAAASGLPVIATGWSGHMDFMKNGKFIDLYYQLEKIHHSRVDNNLFMLNSKWANVSEESFKTKITKFRNNPSIPKEWAKDLQKIILSKYNFNEIKSMYELTFGGILNDLCFRCVAYHSNNIACAQRKNEHKAVR